MREYLLRIFGDRQFSDTLIPLSLVAVDLDSGEEMALSEGPLVDAIRATISVPGVFCPADWRGRRLVDGGLTNSVPADVVRDMGAECVIAVDVGYTAFEPLAQESARRLLSLPGLVRLNPVAGILTRSLHIMEMEITRHRLAAAHPDLVIHPAIGAVNIEEFETGRRGHPQRRAGRCRGRGRPARGAAQTAVLAPAGLVPRPRLPRKADRSCR